METDPPSSRRHASATGLGAPRSTVEASAKQLRELGSAEDVRRESFSWMSRRVLVESRNDLYAKYIHDIVVDERPRWIAARRAAGENPAFVVNRNLVEFGTVLLVGDPGEGDESQLAVAAALPTDEAESAFMVVVSDVVYATGDVNEYVQKFYEPYKNYPHEIYALPGNHDWYDGLDGFMFHFCGAEPLPRQSYRASSYPGREFLARLAWRKASRPARARLVAWRDTRRPWRNERRPPQPGPYFVIETRHLDFVAIDTGIKGTVDHEQGKWLLEASARPKSKVLLTGKPLVVNNEVHPCEIEWGPNTKTKYRTVDDIVRDPEFGYVAAIGGDIHNYQRYSMPVPGDRRLEYVVSGGGGAYMSATHKIGRADKLSSPYGKSEITEDDTRLYPTRGHSLALYSQELFHRAPGFVAGALVLLLTGLALGLLLWTTDTWKLEQAGVFLAGIGFVQLLYGLLSPLERRRRIAGYGVGLALLGGCVSLVDVWLAGKIGATATTVLVATAPVAVPAGVIAVGGWYTKGHALLTGLLLLMVLATHVLERGTVQTGVRIATAAWCAMVVLVVLAIPRMRRKGIGAGTMYEPTSLPVPRSPAVIVAIVAAVIASLGLVTAVFMCDFSDVAAVAIAAICALPLLYLVLIGVVHIAFARGIREKVEHASIADHAAKYAAQRLGDDPVRESADALDDVDPQLRRLFGRVWPHGGWAAVSPLHMLLPEVLDRDVPPLAKNFLGLEVAAGPAGPVLYIRCYGVTGVVVRDKMVEDEVGPLALRRVDAE